MRLYRFRRYRARRSKTKAGPPVLSLSRAIIHVVPYHFGGGALVRCLAKVGDLVDNV
jgi:hypothetical protein